MTEEKEYKPTYNKKPELILSGRNVYFTSDTHFSHSNIIKYSYRPFFSETEKAELDKYPRNPVYGFKKEDVRKVKISDESAKRMNDAIIDNINSVVKAKDFLIHNGDVGFFETPEELAELRGRINCRNIHLVWGNHDNRDLILKSKAFLSHSDILHVNVHGENVICCHYAMVTWDGAHRGEGWWHLFGHSHGSLNPWIKTHTPFAKCLDVGVDTHEFKPWSFEQVREFMKDKRPLPLDHHGV